jgi:hypothetical protein
MDFQASAGKDSSGEPTKREGVRVWVWAWEGEEEGKGEGEVVRSALVGSPTAGPSSPSSALPGPSCIRADCLNSLSLKLIVLFAPWLPISMLALRLAWLGSLLTSAFFNSSCVP